MTEFYYFPLAQGIMHVYADVDGVLYNIVTWDDDDDNEWDWSAYNTDRKAFDNSGILPIDPELLPQAIQDQYERQFGKKVTQ